MTSPLRPSADPVYLLPPQTQCFLYLTQMWASRALRPFIPGAASAARQWSPRAFVASPASTSSCFNSAVPAAWAPAVRPPRPPARAAQCVAGERTRSRHGEAAEWAARSAAAAGRNVRTLSIGYIQCRVASLQHDCAVLPSTDHIDGQHNHVFCAV